MFPGVACTNGWRRTTSAATRFNRLGKCGEPKILRTSLLSCASPDATPWAANSIPKTSTPKSSYGRTWRPPRRKPSQLQPGQNACPRHHPARSQGLHGQDRTRRHKSEPLTHAPRQAKLDVRRTGRPCRCMLRDVLGDPFRADLGAHAGLLDAAEGRGIIRDDAGVEANHAEFDLFGHAQRPKSRLYT